LADDEKKDAPPPDPAAQGIATLRETTKWLIASLAAVGAALLAGLSLSALGHAEDLRLVAAIAGVALGLAGIVVAILFACEVLQPAVATFDGIERSTTPAVVALRGDKEMLGGRTWKELRDDYDADLEAWNAARVADPAPANLATVQRRFTDVDATRRGVFRIAAFHEVAARFERAKLAILGGAVAAGVGIGLFAWGANPPEPKAPAAPAGTAAPEIAAPLPLVVTLSDDGERRLGTLLGCKTRDLQAIAVGGTIAEPEVVTTGPAPCRSVRFTVTSQIGTVARR
jgi:hypothetical protein